MSNIFITGANGFLGKRVVKFFLDRKDTVSVLIKDRNRKTDLSMLAQIEHQGSVIYGDIQDRNLIRNIIGRGELDYVVHLAAIPIVKLCHADPWSAYNTNAFGSLVLYEAIRDQMYHDKRIKKIIHMSTDKAYACSSPMGGYKETTPLSIGDSYCTSKAIGDMIAQSYAKTYQLPICIVRCGNLYGVGDLSESRLIPNSITKLLNGESPELYSGVADYIREFIYVDNVPRAYQTLLEKGVPGEIYHIGGTVPQRIKDVICLIRDKINPEIEIKITNREFFEIKEQYLDASKLLDLGWKPEVELSEGLDKTIQWFKNRCGE